MKAKLYRNKELSVNLFDNENLDGEEIEPLTTENVLVKSKPVTKISKWGVTPFWTSTGSSSGFQVIHQNPLVSVERSDLEDTLSFVNRRAITSNNTPDMSNFIILRAKNNLSNIVLSIDEIKIAFYIPTGSDFYDNWNSPVKRLYLITEKASGTDNTIKESNSTTLDFDFEFIDNVVWINLGILQAMQIST